MTAHKHPVVEASLIWVWGLANRVRTAALPPAQALSRCPLQVSLSLVSLGDRYRLAGLRSQTSSLCVSRGQIALCMKNELSALLDRSLPSPALSRRPALLFLQFTKNGRGEAGCGPELNSVTVWP